MACSCGSNDADFLDGIVHKFSFKDFSWSVFSKVPASESGRTRCSVVSMTNNTVLLYGGSYYDDLTSDIIITSPNRATKYDRTQSFSYPMERQSAYATLFGNTLYILGGQGAMNDVRLRSFRAALSDIWQLRIGPVCTNGIANASTVFGEWYGNFAMLIIFSIPCQSGSYESNGACITCPKGFYSVQPGSKQCSPCLEGFFTSGAGSTSPKEYVVFIAVHK